MLFRSARELGLKVLLDGARLWNTHVATGTPLAAFAASADFTMLSFAKGLGAPVGAALAGSAVSAVLSGVGASALTRLALSGVAFAGTVGFGAWGLGVSELTQVATMVLRRAYSRRNHA